MNLQNRMDIFSQLGKFLMEGDKQWHEVKQKASAKNPWFTPEFIDYAVHRIVTQYLDPQKLQEWTAHYHLDEPAKLSSVGIVMAGNIPLVGFNDFLCVLMSGHRALVKLSAKDDTLLPFLAEKLVEIEPAISEKIQFAENLKNCDAYIATGGSQSARYFEKYFAAYPHIIRKNRTSVAVLDGTETTADLEKLADDIHLYFGLGCRNVTKIFVPKGYDFIPLLEAFNRYLYMRDHYKYANNYDYQLSILLLNNRYYMTNGSTLLTEQENIFSPISVLHYEYYDKKEELLLHLSKQTDIQCIAGKSFLPFGTTQQPGLFTYADGVDTMQFLLTL